MQIKSKILSVIFLGLLPMAATAQDLFLGPMNPTSADQLQLYANGSSCFANSRFKGANPYSVSMKNNHITITLSDQLEFLSIAGISFAKRYIDIGKLPAGQYTWSVEGETGLKSCHERSAPKNQPLTVTDARKLTPAPHAVQDISGHWWNYTDSGSWLFFSQDEKDNLTGAWFTYDKNGLPKWYVFQPKWQTWDMTELSNLYEASRLPGSVSPAVGRTELKVVGKARFVLQGETGIPASPTNLPSASISGQRFAFVYQFTGEAQKAIEMRRFTETPPRLPN